MPMGIRNARFPVQAAENVVAGKLRILDGEVIGVTDQIDDGTASCEFGNKFFIAGESEWGRCRHVNLLSMEVTAAAPVSVGAPRSRAVAAQRDQISAYPSSTATRLA
jgi:hypothetical protein